MPVGVTAAQKDAVTFDEIFKLYYALKAPYRKKAQFLCNEALVLQLMTIKDNNGNYIWKPGLEIGKPDTLLNRPLKTSAFMPEIKGGSKVMAFGDYSYYWVADRQNRTFRRLNELYARTDQVGFPDHPACGWQADPCLKPYSFCRWHRRAKKARKGGAGYGTDPALRSEDLSPRRQQ